MDISAHFHFTLDLLILNLFSKKSCDSYTILKSEIIRNIKYVSVLCNTIKFIFRIRNNFLSPHQLRHFGKGFSHTHTPFKMFVYTKPANCFPGSRWQETVFSPWNTDKFLLLPSLSVHQCF